MGEHTEEIIIPGVVNSNEPEWLVLKKAGVMTDVTKLMKYMLMLLKN